MDPNKHILLSTLPTTTPSQPNATPENFQVDRSINRLTEVVQTMTDGEQQELVVPEADERSRWIVRHPVGCAGVSLVCIYCQLVTDDPPLTLLILVLGLLAVFLYDLAWLYANDRYLYPENNKGLIDKFLMLY